VTSETLGAWWQMGSTRQFAIAFHLAMLKQRQVIMQEQWFVLSVVHDL